MSRKGSRTFRKLILPDGTWEWRVGTTATQINAPDGRRFTVDHSTLTGRSWATIERGHWKRTSDAWITPSDVRRYIERVIYSGVV